jgi:hypothetical protein
LLSLPYYAITPLFSADFSHFDITPLLIDSFLMHYAAAATLSAAAIFSLPERCRRH